VAGGDPAAFGGLCRVRGDPAVVGDSVGVGGDPAVVGGSVGVRVPGPAGGCPASSPRVSRQWPPPDLVNARSLGSGTSFLLLGPSRAASVDFLGPAARRQDPQSDSAASRDLASY
jgi:hypothetical protein